MTSQPEPRTPFRLTDFAGVAGLVVLRDGVFDLTGKLSTPLDGLCVPLRSPRYAEEANANARIAAVITTREIAPALDTRLAVAVADRPDEVHSEVHALCVGVRESELRARPTLIDASARIDPGAHVATYGVEIGPRCHIGSGVTLLPGVCIEADCVLHPGVSLGVPGFNVGKIGGRQRIIPQLGGVRLRECVELLSNVCVAKALFGGETTIGVETVVDNLTYIAHDVQIGRQVQICALVNLLGRVEVGDKAYIGPSSVVVNGAKIGEGAKVSIGAVVTRDVPPQSTVSGNFAIPHDRFLDNLRSIR